MPAPSHTTWIPKRKETGIFLRSTGCESFSGHEYTIDIVLNRKPWVDAALVLLELSRQKRLSLVDSDISFVNLAYVLRKAMSPADMYSTMTDMLRYMSVAAAGESIITAAVSLRWKDMEDCVQYLSARQAGADCIISRNAADFGEADIPVMTPVELLSTIL